MLLKMFEKAKWCHFLNILIKKEKLSLGALHYVFFKRQKSSPEHKLNTDERKINVRLQI